MPDFLTPLLVSFAVAALIGVILEEAIHVSKAKVTLFFGTLSWVLMFIFSPDETTRAHVNTGLAENIAEIAGLWLFLVATMTFIAYLNKKGMIENLIYLCLPKQIGERSLLFITGIFCFFLSSLVDNITATLVSVTLILSLKMERLKTVRFATLVIFAVNSGGAALITGDVTTLMIFLAGKLQIGDFLLLSLPAFIAVLALAAMLSVGLSQTLTIQPHQTTVRGVDAAIAVIFIATIIGALVSNVLYQIPPVLSFLTGLSTMFLVAHFFDPDADQDPVLEYIRKIEFETLLFFLGILLLVGMLKELHVLDAISGLYDLMPALMANYVVGLLSAAIDNVPLTAALLKSGVEMSKPEWMGLTYTVGVGGSLLIIGSAAGIVAMSKVRELTFASYLRYAWLSLLAYTLGYAGVVWMGKLALGA